MPFGISSIEHDKTASLVSLPSPNPNLNKMSDHRLVAMDASSASNIRRSVCFMAMGILSGLVLCLNTPAAEASAAKLGSALLTATVAPPIPPESSHFKLGSNSNPLGHKISVNSQCLLLNGQPWTPVMGEFHFSRYPHNEWREELLKMKAGGVDVVATYFFWIHHEEIEGEWNWSGDRDLRKFIQLCSEVGLKAIVRCGPWCHGEVRNGGHPDWLLKKGWKLRSNDSNYLAKATLLYGQIAQQLSGLLWKDGGPVIGIQLENEFRGPADHLLKLKEIARRVGLDVPLYTRTGWPQLSSPMPFGEILPLYGVYAEGFWDRELKSMPGNYWAGFHFSMLRTDANIANEVLGRGNAKDAADVAKYPYLTCEIGGGMMSSYHRRMQVFPADIEATTLVKLGSGSTSPGYYMYHGGVNPEGKLSTLNESQATGEWNDLPVKNYDFQTALGQYGQVRPQYHVMRRQHLFLHEWGSQLAGMSVNLPDQRPAGKNDLDTLRWAVRSDGRSGFLFVNNYQRLQALPPKSDVQFKLNLTNDALTLPNKPITVPEGSRFIWPFNMDLGNGVKLAWATAQPICAIEDGNVRTVFFAETKGIPAEFAFAHTNLVVFSMLGKISPKIGLTLVHDVIPQKGSFTKVQFSLATNAPAVMVVLLTEAESLALWKGEWQGRERAFLTEAGLVTDCNTLRLTSTDRTKLNVSVFPPPQKAPDESFNHVAVARKGIFTVYTPPPPKPYEQQPTFGILRLAGPAREIPLGKGTKPVAAQPTDTDFSEAAVMRINLPTVDLATDPILRLHYVGDVARVTLNGKLINDDFYNGETLDIGLRRYAPEIMKGELQVAILPLRHDAPIHLPEQSRPTFNQHDVACELKSVELIPRYQVEINAK
ncbi:MAG: hypothetical protein RLY20_73 [Verrucomicrobiota bacterium]